MCNNLIREDKPGWHAYLEEKMEGRHDIKRIIDNNPNVRDFRLEHDFSESLSAVAWEILGHCISNNDHLETVSITTVHDFIDSDMAMFFRGLMHSVPMKELTLSGNGFGLDGIKSMVPFLRYSPNLSHLAINGSHNIDAECFEVLVDALRESSVETLSISGSVEDISALEVELYEHPHLAALDCWSSGRCKLPNLHTLDLDNNNIRNISSLEHYIYLKELYLENNAIGRDGCMVISDLLKKEDSSLRVLGLNSTGMGDDEAEILADSLQGNTTLTDLSLFQNQFGERCYKAFLKLLNDVSSIERTFNSNHSLVSLDLPYPDSEILREVKHSINSALALSANDIDRGQGSYPEAIGRVKVVETQLNSRKREQIAHNQGIEYCFSDVFSGLNQIVLPEVFLLAGSKHGQNEIYRMLLAMPELVLNVNEKSVQAKSTGDLLQKNVAAAVEMRQQEGVVDSDTSLKPDRSTHWIRRPVLKQGRGRKINLWRNIWAK